MARLLRSLYTFYLHHFFIGFALSMCCGIIYFLYGIHTFTFLFWFKVITMCVVYFTVNDARQKEFYYFQNLGISKKILWITTLGIDFILFIALLILAHHTR